MLTVKKAYMETLKTLTVAILNTPKGVGARLGFKEDMNHKQEILSLYSNSEREKSNRLIALPDG